MVAVQNCTSGNTDLWSVLFLDTGNAVSPDATDDQPTWRKPRRKSQPLAITLPVKGTLWETNLNLDEYCPACASVGLCGQSRGKPTLFHHILRQQHSRPAKIGSAKYSTQHRKKVVKERAGGGTERERQRQRENQRDRTKETEREREGNRAWGGWVGGAAGLIGQRQPRCGRWWGGGSVGLGGSSSRGTSAGMAHGRGGRRGGWICNGISDSASVSDASWCAVSGRRPQSRVLDSAGVSRRLVLPGRHNTNSYLSTRGYIRSRKRRPWWHAAAALFRPS